MLKNGNRESSGRISLYPFPIRFPNRAGENTVKWDLATGPGFATGLGRTEMPSRRHVGSRERLPEMGTGTEPIQVTKSFPTLHNSRIDVVCAISAGRSSAPQP